MGRPEPIEIVIIKVSQITENLRYYHANCIFLIYPSGPLHLTHSCKEFLLKFAMWICQTSDNNLKKEQDL